MKNPVRLLICLSLLPTFLAHAEQWPRCKIADTVHESACTSKEWHDIQARLTELSEGRATTQLVRLTRTYLCGKGASAQKDLLRYAADKVHVFAEGTGQDPTSEVYDAREALKPQRGHAWDASVSSTYEGHIQLSFWPDEACISAVLFEHSHGNWIITQLSGACD